MENIIFVIFILISIALVFLSFYRVSKEIPMKNEKSNHEIEDMFFYNIMNKHRKEFQKQWKKGGDLYFFNFVYNNKKYEKVSLMVFKNTIDRFVENISKEPDEWRKEKLFIAILYLSKDRITLKGNISICNNGINNGKITIN